MRGKEFRIRGTLREGKNLGVDLLKWARRKREENRKSKRGRNRGVKKYTITFKIILIILGREGGRKEEGSRKKGVFRELT